MKAIYIDCFSGISGDMFLGALVDLGLDVEHLKNELGKLALTGWDIKCEKVMSNGITGSKLTFDITEEKEERTYKAIVDIIEKSSLSQEVKELSLNMFKDLAEVEGKIHDKDPVDVHFHEIGAVDSILDIVGAAIGIKKLEIEEIFVSKIHVGEGFIECRHGLLPVPVPATMELIKGLPIYSTGIQGELVTPTGAVILKNISKKFGQMPEIKIDKIGYGAGTKNYGIPNLLRLMMGVIVR